MIMKVEEVCLWMMEGRYLEDWMERKEEVVGWKERKDLRMEREEEGLDIPMDGRQNNFHCELSQ
jgi:hypothetical protein